MCSLRSAEHLTWEISVEERFLHKTQKFRVSNKVIALFQNFLLENPEKICYESINFMISSFSMPLSLSKSFQYSRLRGRPKMSVLLLDDLVSFLNRKMPHTKNFILQRT